MRPDIDCGDGNMRGPGWIKGLREDEARELRSEISRLELALFAACNSEGMHKVSDVARTLRWQKLRLQRLEDWIASMASKGQPSTSIEGSIHE
jgi:hypothetical protein